MNLMSIIEKQWKLVAGLFVLLIIGGGVMATLSIQNASKEQKAQASYFLSEKKFLELKNKKETPPAATAKDKKAAPVDNTPADYTAVKQDFEKVIQDYPKSKAAQMSALYLSDILSTEKNTDLALATLKKVENTNSGLVNLLVQQQIGNLLADKNQCQEAIQAWQKIIDNKEAAFLQSELKIQQALCYQKLNDSKKAEELLTNLANQKSENSLEASSTSKEAEKYLRLIQFKKASGS